ncbi:thioesterase II family protein [Sphaerisporangium album]|uniref:thioesterase II family protein n=1 Tax=Sphaerisporangium album TaxID=509200 RepID=UPI001C68A6F1|nr:alpha/beta fold hydrolase [Sphaerisporangium album]
MSARPAVPAPARGGDGSLWRSSPWIRCWSPRPAARLRLVCLPHAGGGASAYRPWAALLPPEVELLTVQYPGREDRFQDPLVDGMQDLVTRIAGALTPALDRPYALFGHSMGSAVAWELAHELRHRGAPAPRRLFVSGREAPGTATAGEVHRQTDEVLCRELERLGGTSLEVLADDGVRPLVLGYIRNDYRLIETYRPVPRTPLSCPIAVFAGESDPELTPGSAGGWAELTTGHTEVRSFPGGHFYLNRQRREVVGAVLRRLDPSLARGDHRWPSTP